jgi:hypothetical protein
VVFTKADGTRKPEVLFTKADVTRRPEVLFTKADVTRKPRGVNHQHKTSRGSLEVLLTKTDVTRKPGLARGPVAYILRLSIPLLDETRTKYQTPKQYCDHSDHLAGETNNDFSKNEFNFLRERHLNRLIKAQLLVKKLF